MFNIQTAAVVKHPNSTMQAMWLHIPFKFESRHPNFHYLITSRCANCKATSLVLYLWVALQVTNVSKYLAC